MRSAHSHTDMLLLHVTHLSPICKNEQRSRSRLMCLNTLHSVRWRTYQGCAQLHCKAVLHAN